MKREQMLSGAGLREFGRMRTAERVDDIRCGAVRYIYVDMIMIVMNI